MKARDPIKIPELLVLIANYLEQRDLVICLRVCRSWNGLLRPLVWKYVTIGDVVPKEPSLHDIERYSQHVLKLMIVYPYGPRRLPLALPNLRKLKLEYCQYKPSHDSYDSQFNPTQFIALHHSLVYLSARSNCMGEMDTLFWGAVFGLPRLKRLRIEEIEICSTWVDVFWDVCSKLEDLCLVKIGFPEDGMRLAKRSFPRIRKLTIRYSDVTRAEEFEIIRRCKNLEDLTWQSLSGNDEYDGFPSAVEQGALPKLKRLDIYFGSEKMSDKNAERIIYGMQKVAKLILYSPEFGPLSLRALRRHFSTIVDLNIWSSPSVASEILQELMCSCPLLERFRGGCIQAKDVVGGNAWVCLSMKELEMGFAFEESEQDLQPLIFKRLSSLVLIEKFDFYINLVEVKPHQLDMRLMSGLGQLSHWKNIKILSVWRSKQSMEEIDVRWMIENWPRLSTVCGGLNDDRYTNECLREMLRARDITEY